MARPPSRPEHCGLPFRSGPCGSGPLVRVAKPLARPETLICLIFQAKTGRRAATQSNNLKSPLNFGIIGSQFLPGSSALDMNSVSFQFSHAVVRHATSLPHMLYVAAAQIKGAIQGVGCGNIRVGVGLRCYLCRCARCSIVARVNLRRSRSFSIDRSISCACGGTGRRGAIRCASRRRRAKSC